jgi:hypothetical protein
VAATRADAIFGAEFLAASALSRGEAREIAAPQPIRRRKIAIRDPN